MTGQVRPGIGKKAVVSRMRNNKSLKKHICDVYKDKKRLWRRKGNKIHIHQDKQVKKESGVKDDSQVIGLMDRE